MSSKGWNSTYVTCNNGRDNVIRLLLGKGADVNKSSEILGSPLHAACKYGSHNIVNLLLDKGADVNLCFEQVGSPLYSACKYGRSTIVRLFWTGAQMSTHFQNY